MSLLCAIVFAASRVASAAPAPNEATFSSGQASVDARDLAGWILAEGDNEGLPIVIIDKSNAMAFAINPAGRQIGAAPALLGLGRGDVSPPGVGDRRLADIPPQDRITPAGRFVAELGKNLGGKTILWVDYEAAISLHAVINTKPADRRLQRLATLTSADNRISYGCINVPVSFFNGIIVPLFAPKGGVVYVLPEAQSLASIFFTKPRHHVPPTRPGPLKLRAIASPLRD